MGERRKLGNKILKNSQLCPSLLSPHETVEEKICWGLFGEIAGAPWKPQHLQNGLILGMIGQYVLVKKSISLFVTSTLFFSEVLIAECNKYFF